MDARHGFEWMFGRHHPMRPAHDSSPIRTRLLSQCSKRQRSDEQGYSSNHRFHYRSQTKEGVAQSSQRNAKKTLPLIFFGFLLRSLRAWRASKLAKLVEWK